MRNLSSFIQILIILFLGLFLNANVNSQNIKPDDVIGVFSEVNSNPEGGETLIILPDNTYILAYFGGLQKGNWRIDGNILQLDRIAEPIFVLYGRKLKSLEDKFQIDFTVESDNPTAISINPKIEDSLKLIFNIDANCLAYPYSISKREKLLHFEAAKIHNEHPKNSDSKNLGAKIYNYKNLEDYNDFVLVNLPSEYTSALSIQATYKNNVLYIERGGEMVKSPLESIETEELEEIKAYTKHGILPNSLEHDSEFFPSLENPTQEHYTTFPRLKPSELSLDKKIVLEKDSFFMANCE